MTLASNLDGSEALIVGLNEVSEATGLETRVVLQLYARGLFPDPLHHHPPLWSAKIVAEWVGAAACVTRVEIPTRAKRKTRRSSM